MNYNKYIKDSELTEETSYRTSLNKKERVKTLFNYIFQCMQTLHFAIQSIPRGFAGKHRSGLVPPTGDSDTAYKESQFLNANGKWSTVNAETVNDHTVNSDVPSNAQFTDTTDLSKMSGQLEATKLSGTIPLSNLPQGALDRQINVANKTARLALTKDDVQNGDTVQEDDTELMYRVVDESKLGTSTPEKAFKEYTAGRATYASESGMVNGHTVKADVPDNAKFTDKRSSYYGVCETASTVKDKIVTLVDGDDFELRAGIFVSIKFKNSNTYNATAESHVTLNVNNTGAKPIYWGNTANPTGSSNIIHGVANYVHYYVYDGEQWVWAGWSKDNNTTYSVVSKTTNGLCPKLPDETSTSKFLRQDGTWSDPVKASAIENALGYTPLNAKVNNSVECTIKSTDWKANTDYKQSFLYYDISVGRIYTKPSINILPLNPNEYYLPTKTEYIEYSKIVSVETIATTGVPIIRLYAFEQPTSDIKIEIIGVE